MVENNKMPEKNLDFPSGQDFPLVTPETIHDPKEDVNDIPGESIPDHTFIAQQEREQNQKAEQLLKQQHHEQNDRRTFSKGNAQEHQQGNKQR